MPRYTTQLVSKVINELYKTDPRWSSFLNVKQVHTDVKYKSLFRYIKDKLRWLKKHPYAVLTASKAPVNDEMIRDQLQEEKETAANKVFQYNYLDRLFARWDVSIDDIINTREAWRNKKEKDEYQR